MNWVVPLGAFILAMALGLMMGQSCSDAGVDEALAKAQTEAIESRAREDGWRTALVETQEDLVAAARDRLAHGDTADALRRQIDELLAEVELLNGEVQDVTEIAATLESQLQAAATEHQTGEIVDSVTAALDDGLLDGRIAYFPSTSLFDLQYRARIRAALVDVTTPDGRHMVAARADDPRVTLEIASHEVQTPEPVRVCSLGQKASAFSIGGGVGLIAGALLR